MTESTKHNETPHLSARQLTLSIERSAHGRQGLLLSHGRLRRVSLNPAFGPFHEGEEGDDATQSSPDQHDRAANEHETGVPQELTQPIAHERTDDDAAKLDQDEAQPIHAHALPYAPWQSSTLAMYHKN